MISAAAILVRAYVCVSLVQFNGERVKMLKTEMLRLLRNEEIDEEQTDKEENDDERA